MRQCRTKCLHRCHSRLQLAVWSFNLSERAKRSELCACERFTLVRNLFLLSVITKKAFRLMTREILNNQRWNLCLHLLSIESRRSFFQHGLAAYLIALMTLVVDMRICDVSDGFLRRWNLFPTRFTFISMTWVFFSRIPLVLTFHIWRIRCALCVAERVNEIPNCANMVMRDRIECLM